MWTAPVACGQRRGRSRRRPTVPVMPAPAPTGADAAPPSCPATRWRQLLGRGGSGEVWRAVPRRGGAPVAVKVLVGGRSRAPGARGGAAGRAGPPAPGPAASRWCTSRAAAGPPRVALVLDLLAGRQPRRPARPPRPAAAGRGGHGDRAGGGGARPRPRAAGSCTATCRPATSSSPPRAGRSSPTSASPGVLGETAAGEVTPAYVDPTVARGGAAGPASDVFGVAAAAFHALTGIAPWNAATPADTLAVAADGLPARPRRAGAGGAGRSCSRSSGAGWPPIRTTAGPRRRSRSTCGTPAARAGATAGGGVARTPSRARRAGPAYRADPPGARPAAAAGADDRRAGRPAGPAGGRPCASGPTAPARPLRRPRRDRGARWSPPWSWRGWAAPGRRHRCRDGGRRAAGAGRSRRPPTAGSPRRLLRVVPAADDGPPGRPQEAPADRGRLGEPGRRAVRASRRGVRHRLGGALWPTSTRPAARCARPTRQHAGELRAAGEALRGFAPEVVGGDRRQRDGDRVGAGPGRPAGRRTTVVPAGDRTARTAPRPGRPAPASAWCWSGPPDGWRIDSARAAGLSRRPVSSRASAACRAASSVGVAERGSPRPPEPAARPAGRPSTLDRPNSPSASEMREPRAPAGRSAGARPRPGCG